MLTRELLNCLPVKQVLGTLPEEVEDLAVDSRSVLPGGMFVCIKGFTVDGHDFVNQAISNGARIIVAEREVDIDTTKAALVLVQNTQRAIGWLSSAFYRYPSKKMTMIGVTGTNGKTSVSGIIHHILRNAGERSALSGTIGFNLNGILYESANTTSDVLSTQQMIHQAVAEDCQSMIMEVSSHGLVEGRLAGVDFDIAVFTNLTHDHLDFHGTMERYGQAKGLLFAQLGQDFEKQKFAVLNADDPWSERMMEMTSFPVLTYGIRNDALFKGTNIKVDELGTAFDMETPSGSYHVKMRLIGEFNVSNALAATAALYAKGMPIELIVEQLREIPPIKGRMEKVETEAPISIFIDYAHTPDAIEKAISSVEPYEKNKLIFLIGTGGNRDKSKRPTMAEKASAADYVILTTDDPRYEEYDSIVNDLAKGMKHEHFACIGDRAEAVKHAIEIAEPGDMIIFAGKGHEDYQIIGNTKFPHSDTQIALSEAKKKFSDSTQLK